MNALDILCLAGGDGGCVTIGSRRVAVFRRGQKLVMQQRYDFRTEVGEAIRLLAGHYKATR